MLFFHFENSGHCQNDIKILRNKTRPPIQPDLGRLLLSRQRLHQVVRPNCQMLEDISFKILAALLKLNAIQVTEYEGHCQLFTGAQASVASVCHPGSHKCVCFGLSLSLQKQFKNLVVRPKFTFPLSLGNGGQSHNPSEKGKICQKYNLSSHKVGPEVPRGSAGPW